MAEMTLEEALAAATVDDVSVDRVLVIDSELRTISIPGTVKNLGVESDDDVNRLYFRMPKTYRGFDLSAFDIRINYKNGNTGDAYAVEDKAVEGDDITFSWLVGRNAVKVKGATQFIVCFKRSDSSGVVQQEFNTTVASLNVLEGLETTEQIVQENPDIIEQILKRIDGLTEISPEDIAQAVVDYMAANPIKSVEYIAQLLTDAQKLQARTNIGAAASGGYARNKNVVTDESGNLKTEDKPLYIPQAESAKDGHMAVFDTDGSLLRDGGEVPKKLPNPQKLTFTGAVTAEYDGSGAVTVTIPEGSGGSGGTVRIEKGSTDTTVELEPNKLYVLPEMTELSITLAEPSDTGIVSEYHFVFHSGTTATTLTIPDAIKIPSGFTVDTNKIYEISIMEGCLCAQSWEVTA